MYTIQKKHITEPKFSVDGKKHTRTLYYAGIFNIDGLTSVRWNTRTNAHFFIREKEAQEVCKRYGGTVVEVK